MKINAIDPPRYSYSVVPCGLFGRVVVTIRSYYAPDAGGYDAVAIEYAKKLGANATPKNSVASGRLRSYRLEKLGVEPSTILVLQV